MNTFFIIFLIVLSILFAFFLINTFFSFTKSGFVNKDKEEKERYYEFFIDKINVYLREINILKHKVKDKSTRDDINECIFFLRMIALDMDKDIVILNIFKELEEYHLSYFTNVLKNYCLKQDSCNYDDMDKIAAVIHRYTNIFINFSKELNGEKALKELEELRDFF